MASFLPYKISKRISLRKNGHGELPPAVSVAVAGVTLSLMVILLSLAVTSGFKQAISQKIYQLSAPVSVSIQFSNDIDSTQITCWSQKIIDLLPAKSKIIQTASLGVIAKYGLNSEGLLLKAVGEGYNWGQTIFLNQGSIPHSASNEIAISQSTANTLGINIGDKLSCYFFNNNTLRERKFTVSGIYYTGISSFDESIAITSLNTPALNGILKHIHTVDFEIYNIDSIEYTTDLLNAMFLTTQNSTSEILTWEVTNPFQQYATFFNWLEMIDTNIVIILCLMACVSALMLLSCLLVLILEHTKMIACLKAMGATNSFITHLFSGLGLRVVVVGVLLANLLSAILYWAQTALRFIPLDPESYYIDYVPMYLSWQEWIITNIIFIIFSALVLYLPAIIINNLHPAPLLQEN